MKFAPTLEVGRLLKRYKRFLADIETASGEQLTIHCPNTGSMLNCMSEGCRVWFSRSNDPKRKRAALIFLGNAFLREGMTDLAETQLLRALEGKFTMDDEGKLIHYQLGLVNERLKRPEKARELYQKILAADFNYKDVTERLKKLDGGGATPQ